MRSDVVDLTIQSIAAGGDGVARTEGFVVFIPRTAPGDRVHATLERNNRFARGTLVDVVEASNERVEPPCEHYRVDQCGGCQLQHLGYDAQREAKAGIIRDTLARIGKRDVAAPSVRASERRWRYRTKLTLGMRRTGDGWVVGLHPYDDPVALFQLRDCPITDERVVAVWREVMSAAELLPNGDELRGAVRLVGDGASITIEGGTRWATADQFLARVPSVIAVWWAPDEAPRRLVASRGHAPAGASFTQINAGVAEDLRDHVLALVRERAPRTVLDAYAGIGDTAAPLAESGSKVTAIERDREAAAVCASRLPSGSRVLTGKVEDLIAAALPVDAVIVNPPRTGMHERATALLQRTMGAPRVLVYVSCNPATLARDLARMPRYRIASLLAFDMFPQTAHVETVCELVPEGEGSA
jgi:23S rRNA (uracil1939-C5)-methyltransferase